MGLLLLLGVVYVMIQFGMFRTLIIMFLSVLSALTVLISFAFGMVLTFWLHPSVIQGWTIPNLWVNMIVDSSWFFDNLWAVFLIPFVFVIDLFRIMGHIFIHHPSVFILATTLTGIAFVVRSWLAYFDAYNKEMEAAV